MRLSQGARVLVGHCHETEQALPLNPWIEALRADRLTLDPRPARPPRRHDGGRAGASLPGAIHAG